MAKDYVELLTQLHEGKLASFEITTEEFMAFQKVLQNYNYRKNVVGVAKRGGGVTYHYRQDNN